jgi:hypothetical protein
MLDGGKAKTDYKDPHIKSVPKFEPRSISKLLKSPYYLGRGYCDTREPEKFIKNRQICNLIDEIRYKNGSREIYNARLHSAKLHYEGFVQPQLNGGGASAIYGFAEQLDLGNAGPNLHTNF